MRGLVELISGFSAACRVSSACCLTCCSHLGLLALQLVQPLLQIADRPLLLLDQPAQLLELPLQLALLGRLRQ